ncbi:BatD family protein [Prevotella sp. KH2C16]|uniref:DUF4381 family protein n=1 Tax=Prevotella sp. KH2C16 TaxID=1855325 RepID=UPI0008EE9DD1|nr:BatD family protein [Prevotella sp. KH2C16]SFF99579.1 hypothetical protein SAMN05216383_103160 [Prevotella sp. KH2C16]
MLRNIISLFCVVCSLTATAQISVEQQIDSIGILIGQQAHLSVKVTAPKGARIQWPEFKPSQYITPGVEVLEASNADTANLDNNLMAVTKAFTITSFDEKLYPIPGIKVKVNGKTYTGNTSALKVITVDVDTLHPNQFFPPKDVQDNPFMWNEWSCIFWLSVFLLILCVLAVYLFVRLKQNKPVIAKVRIVKKILPHQKALNAIDRIKAEHLQRSEDQKTYYTQLTDTLRRYINERFGFNAMEMTSSEIIEHLQQNGDQTMINELRELFQTADLVKFAKYQSLINENDLNLVNAINFIDGTKLEGQPTEERIIPQITEEAKRSRKSRMAILAAICIIAVSVVALLVYVIYSAYQLVN